MVGYRKIGLFVGGALFGSVGVGLLTGRDAKRVYAHVTAAAMRAKELVMRKLSSAQAQCGDILADAKEINAQREAQVVHIADSSSADETKA